VKRHVALPVRIVEYKPCGSCKHIQPWTQSWSQQCGASPTLLLVKQTDSPVRCPGHEPKEAT